MKSELKEKINSVIDKAIESAKEWEKQVKAGQEQEQQRLLECNLPTFKNVLRQSIGEELMDVMTFVYFRESADCIKALFPYRMAKFELWRSVTGISTTYHLVMIYDDSRIKKEIPYLSANFLMLAVDEMYNG